jgi:hypothetical protein
MLDPGVLQRFDITAAGHLTTIVTADHRATAFNSMGKTVFHIMLNLHPVNPREPGQTLIPGSRSANSGFFLEFVYILNFL